MASGEESEARASMKEEGEADIGHRGEGASTQRREVRKKQKGDDAKLEPMATETFGKILNCLLRTAVMYLSFKFPAGS